MGNKGGIREVYTIDGIKITATRGRPPKPSLSQEEQEAVMAILRLPRGTHGSSLERAALEVSLMRGSHTATDPRTRKSRSVTGRWISDQLKRLGFAGKKELHEKMGTIPRKHDSKGKVRPMGEAGTRITTAPSTNAQPLMNGPPTQVGKPSTHEVDSERGGAA